MKKIVAILLAALIVIAIIIPAFAVSEISTENIQTKIQTDSMEKFHKENDDYYFTGLDIKEKINEQWISSTFGEYGYHVFLFEKPELEENCTLKHTDFNDLCVTLDNHSYDFAASKLKGSDVFKMKVDAEEENGHAVISYSVTNVSDTDKECFLGIASDVCVNNDDYAKLYLLNNGKAFRMVNYDNTENKRVMFTLSFPMNIDTSFIGTWDAGLYMKNLFSQSALDKEVSGDSALCFSWRKMIPAGQTVVFKNNLELALNDVPVLLAEQKDLKINLKVKDNNIDLIKIFVKENDEMKEISSYMSDGSTKEFEYDLSERTCGTKHALTFYAEDAMGTKSEEITVNVTIPHKWQETSKTESSCYTKGTANYICEKCKETKIENLELKAHDFTEWVIKTEPDCLNAGSKERICNVCKKVETEEISALGHDWKVEWTWNEYKSATCTVTCKRDKAHTESVTDKMIDSRQIPASVCTDTETTIYTAEVTIDGKTYTDIKEKNGNPGAHLIGDWSVEKEPTCEEKGLKVKKCSKCGLVIESAEIDALGHDYKVTYEWNGTECTAMAICSHNSEHKIIEKANINEVLKQTPTCTKTGSKIVTAFFKNSIFKKQSCNMDVDKTNHTDLNNDKKCDVCGAEITEQVIINGKIDVDTPHTGSNAIGLVAGVALVFGVFATAFTMLTKKKKENNE